VTRPSTNDIKGSRIKERHVLNGTCRNDKLKHVATVETISEERYGTKLVRIWLTAIGIVLLWKEIVEIGAVEEQTLVFNRW